MARGDTDSYGHKLYTETKTFFMSEADETDTLEVCFNPNEMSLGMQMLTGKLTPVGWSGPARQYGATEPEPIDLVLEFSAIKMADGAAGGVFKDNPQGPVNWFLKHMHGPQKGVAPSPVIFCYPGFVYVTVTVNGCRQRVLQLDRRGTPVRYELNLTLEELRRDYVDSACVGGIGWLPSGWSAADAKNRAFGGNDTQSLHVGRTGGALKGK